MKTHVNDTIEDAESSLDRVFEVLKKHQILIKGVFTKNIKNSGAVVNPDFPIEGLSNTKLGILAHQTYYKAKSLELNGGISPKDFLGVDAEILGGGINLTDILEQTIDQNEHPVINLVSDKALNIKKTLSEYQNLYAKWESRIAEEKKNDVA